MKPINTIVIAVGGKGDRISKDFKRRGFNTSKVFLEVNGKPLLNHLIDMALETKFQRIFLLASYYESDLRQYLKESYRNDNRIIPIYGGQKGRIWGVPWLLHYIKRDLQKPFIYSDGNILYKSSILQKIKSANSIGSSLVNVVLSRKDYAPTHSRVIKCRGQIYDINARLPSSGDKQKRYSSLKQYYSLGLMAWSPQVFSFMPRFAYRQDLDFVVSDIFKLNKALVRETIYQGPWFALHTIKDIDKITKNSKVFIK